MHRPIAIRAFVLATFLICGCTAPGDQEGRKATAPATSAPAPSVTAEVVRPPEDHVPAVLDREALIRLVAEAGKAHASAVRIPPGTYLVTPPGSPERPDSWHLQWEGLRDLTIDATGVLIRLGSRTAGGIRFFDCRGVTLKGLRIERATSPISQGRILAVQAASNDVEVQVDAGYPTDFDDPRFFPHVWFNLIDPASRRWLTHLRADTPPKLTRLAPDRFRINVEKLSTVGVEVVPGQRVVWRGITPADLRYSRCAGMLTTGVTVAGGAGFCFNELGGDGDNRYVECSVIPGPRPTGAIEDPLLASSADGFHSSGVRKGPILERCHFERTDDDAIAIHGDYAMVQEAQGSRIVVLVTPFAPDKSFARVGDHLPSYGLDKVAGPEFTVQAVKTLTDYVPTHQPDDYHQVFKPRKGSVFVELTVTPEAHLVPGALLANAQASGSGYVIRDTTVTECYCRGVIAKGSDGLIENCDFSHIARAGVEFNTETGIWSEADYSRNVVVRGNRFTDVSRNRKTGLLRHPGAVNLFAYHRSSYIPSPGGHRNIRIEENTFTDIDGINVLITSAQGISVTGNTFVRPMVHPHLLGKEKGLDSGALILVHQSDAVAITGNTVVDAGAYLRSRLGCSPSATQITTDFAHASQP